MVFPQAAAGYFVSERVPAYAEMEHDELLQQYYKCTPFEACVGACTAAQLTSDTPDYAACDGASGEDSCAPGYTGDRCSQCAPYDPRRPCSTEESVLNRPELANGWYRLDQECKPCTCTWFTPMNIMLVAFVMLLIIMVAVDHWLKDVDHMSTIFAPIMIVITFFQTLGLLLDLDVAWPPSLRKWMSNFNILNINLQLVRPECSGPFGVKQRLEITLALPVGMALLFGVYAAVQYGLSKRMTPQQFRAKHSGRDVIAHLSRQLLTATVATFMLGSIFFLRNVLSIWNCTLPLIPGGPEYMRSEPAIECKTDGDENNIYNYLDNMAWLGLTVYLAMFGAFSFGLIVKRDLFQFLGDKFE